MSQKVTVVDDYIGNGVGAGVTDRGQLITAPIKYNEAIFRSFTVINTAYNFVKPKAGMRFVIDAIIFSGDRNVTQATGAVIEIYEAQSPTSTTVSNDLFTLDIGRLTGRSITGLNVITSEGVWINGKTDDANTNVTILGYFVKA